MRSARLAIVLASLLGLACGPAPERALRDRVPDLPAVDARHLVSDGDSAYAAYAREVGVMRLLDVESRLVAGLSKRSPEAYSRSLEALGPYLDRVTGRLATEYHLPEFRSALAYRRRIDPRVGLELAAADRHRIDLIAEPDLSAAEKESGLLEVLRTYRETGYHPGVVVAEFALARQVDAQGRSAEGVGWLRRAERHAREWNLTLLDCQVLGALGSWYATLQKPDSMYLCMDRALALARRARHPFQTSRILTFYGNFYWRQGRLTPARDYFAAAYQACREYKGGAVNELRVLNDTLLNLYARLGCWEAVDDLLPRAHLLEREFLASPRSRNRVILVSTRRVEMRLRFARGDMDGARRIFDGIRNTAREGERTTYAGLLESWCEGLLENGADRPALAAAEEGLRYASERNLPESEAQFALDLAQAQVRTGAYAEAGAALERFVRLHPESDDETDLAGWARHDALEAARLDRLGRRGEAATAAARGVERLGKALARMDRSPLAYLRLGTCGILHDEILDLLSDSPEAGYSAEMEWRRLVDWIGTRNRGQAGGEGAEPFRWLTHPAADTPGSRPGPDPAVELRNRLAAHHAVHLVYRVQPNRVIRWTADGVAGVRADTLAAPPDSIRAWVARATKAMAGSPEGARGIPAELGRLAGALLPPEVIDGTAGAEMLLITPDGCLSLLPFEALDLSGGPAYLPLLSRYEVAYLRYQTAVGPPARGDPLVVANPDISPALGRRYPDLRSLAFEPREVAAISTRYPGTRVLAGREATRARILAAWERAPILYVASHVVRDPQAPFVIFIPVAPAGPDAHDPGYIDMEDVAGADLRGCTLAVLAGCASGVPYVAAGGSAPSPGQVFLDAGARAVVQTFFPVRDEDAATAMENFLQAWIVGGEDPVPALTRARRRVLADGAGRGGFAWAAFSIELAGI